MTSRILVGDRVDIDLGPMTLPHAARLWSVRFDGVPVTGVHSVVVTGSAIDIGRRVVVMLAVDSVAPPSDFVLYMRGEGWIVHVVDVVTESVTIDDIFGVQDVAARAVAEAAYYHSEGKTREVLDAARAEVTP